MTRLDASTTGVGEITVLLSSWRLRLQACDLSPRTVGAYTDEGAPPGRVPERQRDARHRRQRPPRPRRGVHCSGASTATADRFSSMPSAAARWPADRPRPAARPRVPRARQPGAPDQARPGAPVVSGQQQALTSTAPRNSVGRRASHVRTLRELALPSRSGDSALFRTSSSRRRHATDVQVSSGGRGESLT